jgi:hypothetical protein
MKMVKDNTKTGLVFHYIRQNGAQSINEVEKALGIDAYQIMHDMKNRGLLLFSTSGGTSRTGIFEILPKAVHTQENIKTPISAFNKKVPGYNDRILRVVIPNSKKADAAFSVLKYAVGKPKKGSLKYLSNGVTQMDISVNDERLEVITNIIHGMRNDGFKVEAEVMKKKVTTTIESQFRL